jgi:Phage Single-stranded DNA-binding protein
MTTDPQTLPATTSSGAVQNATPAYSPLGGLQFQVWASLDLTDERNKVKVLEAIQSANDPKRVGDAVGQTLDIQDVIVHRVEFADEDGVAVDAERVVFLTPKGEMWACVSSGVVRSVQLLAGMYGMPPWKPAMKVQVQQRRTRRGFQTLQLIPVLTTGK